MREIEKKRKKDQISRHLGLMSKKVAQMLEISGCSVYTKRAIF
jgi:hypothetical protein